METRPPLTLEETIAAAQEWWREAGIDHQYHDEPVPWLAEPAAPEPVPLQVTEPERPPVAEAPAMGGEADGWPRDLAAFRDWWLTEPSLDHGGVHPRIASRGPAGAPLMMLVPMPEQEDRESLLSGAQGRLLASFALATGLAPDQIYFAAALPRQMPLPDWERLAETGCGQILRHHIGLVGPERLIVFGSRVLPLLQHDPAQGAPAVSEIEIHGRKVPVLATFAPERLLGNARQRAGLWQRWLDWTGRDT
jgi:DNA polymerase